MEALDQQAAEAVDFLVPSSPLLLIPIEEMNRS